MYDAGIEELQKLMQEAKNAEEYALAHYEELAARKHTYTLYGGPDYGLGVEVPSSITTKGARKLLKKTRRRNHIAYELDEAFGVLRTVHVIEYTRIDCIYHHFDMNGVAYAYPFRGSGSGMYTGQVASIKYEDGRPVYHALSSKNMLFVQFYEYLDSGEMVVSTYRYFPNSKYSQYGCLIEDDAPIGAENSAVQRHSTVEIPNFVNFKKWI